MEEEGNIILTHESNDLIDASIEEEPEVSIENIYFTMEEFDAEANIVENPMTATDASQEEPSSPLSQPESPPLFFIVPYRDREAHLMFFKPHMAQLLANVDYNYNILYLHQKDKRSFNRGAIKNIGFRVIKELLPDTYKDATLVFHDIDSLLTRLPENLEFHTTHGKIKHFYGFVHTLGGIFSITAGDFEKINGFPNFWTWGYEDNMIQNRSQKAGIEIDRSVFFDTKCGPDKIVRLFQNSIREVNRAEYDRYLNLTDEGVHSITDIEYSINEETGFVDVTNFNTGVEETAALTKAHNLAYGNTPFDVKTKNVIRANFRDIGNKTVVPLQVEQMYIQPPLKKNGPAVLNNDNNHTFSLMRTGRTRKQGALKMVI